VLYPTVLGNVQPDMRSCVSKHIAPIVSIYEYTTFEDAVKMIDDSPYGFRPVFIPMTSPKPSTLSIISMPAYHDQRHLHLPRGSHGPMEATK